MKKSFKDALWLGIVIAVATLLVSSATAGTISRTTVFSDGSILTGAQLNTEFNTVYNVVNGGLDNDNISLTAGILPSKIDSSIAGNALNRSSSGVLSPIVDGVTLTDASNQLAVATGGIATINIASAAVTSVKIAAKTITGANLADGGVTTGILGDQSVTTAKLGLNSVTTQIISDHSVTISKLATVSSAIVAGSGGFAISNASGTYSSASSSYQDVTNLLVQLTVTGRPVVVGIIPLADGSVSYVSSSSGAACNLRFVRGAGTDVGDFATPNSSSSVTFPPAGYMTFDLAAAGTYQYKLQAKNASGTCGIANVQLMAFEL